MLCIFIIPLLVIIERRSHPFSFRTRSIFPCPGKTDPVEEENLLRRVVVTTLNPIANIPSKPPHEVVFLLAMFTRNLIACQNLRFVSSRVRERRSRSKKKIWYLPVPGKDGSGRRGKFAPACSCHYTKSHCQHTIKTTARGGFFVGNVHTQLDCVSKLTFCIFPCPEKTEPVEEENLLRRVVIKTVIIENIIF